MALRFCNNMHAKPICELLTDHFPRCHLQNDMLLLVDRSLNLETIQ